MNSVCYLELKRLIPTELINMKEVAKTFQYWLHCAEDDWQILSTLLFLVDWPLN